MIDDEPDDSIEGGHPQVKIEGYLIHVSCPSEV